MEKLNDNLACGKAVCGFRFGLDKIWIFAVPDTDNVGYYVGWVFTFNTRPYFCSIAGGSDMLSTHICNFYARYLADIGEFGSLEKAMGEENVWTLNDNTSMKFYNAFCAAMEKD